MKFSKRILSIILALLIFISVNLTPVSAVTSVSADTETIYTSGDYYYKILDNGTIQIVRYFGTDTNLVIPSIIDGHVVSTVSRSSFSNTTIERITIPNSVTEIEDYAFSLCQSLKSVTIPSSVKSLGECIFQDCYSLSDIVIENGVKRIDDFAFWGCTALKSISIPPSVTYIGFQSIYSCPNLKKIVIPATVTEIGKKAIGYNFNESIQYEEKTKNFSIYGYLGTTGEAYAVENEFEFIPLDKGDADESTAVDINDVTCMQKIIAKINSTNDFKTANCDLNGDGKLNIRDATLLQLFLAKKIDKFPVQE